MRIKHIDFFKYVILGYGLIYLVFSQFMYEYLYYKTFKNMIGYIILSIVIYCFVRWNKESIFSKYKYTIKKDISIITILTLGSRLYVIDSLQILQTSDFGVYLNESILYLRQGAFSESISVYFGAIGNNGLILVLFSKFFGLFGEQLRVGLIINSLFVLLTTYMMYFLIRKIFCQNLAFWTCVIYGIFPSYLAYCIFFGSEPMYIFFLTLGLSVILYSIIKMKGSFTEEVKNFNITIFTFGIFIVTFSQKLRPISIIFIVSICICIYLFKCRNYKFKVIYVIILFTISNFIISTYLYKPNFIISKPGYGWTLYEGSNLYTYGEWSPETADFLSDTIKNNKIEDVQKILLDEAIKNISAYDHFTIWKLYAYKAARLFGNSNGFAIDIRNLYRNPNIFGEQYIEYGKIPTIFNFWMLFATIFYKIVIYLIIYGLLKAIVYLSKNKSERYVNVMVAMILPIDGLSVLHSITACIQRYNVPMIPLLILIAVYTLTYQEETII